MLEIKNGQLLQRIGSNKKIPATVVQLISSIKQNHLPKNCQILVNVILVNLVEDGIVKRVSQSEIWEIFSFNLRI
jgi:hypothetical protein